MAENQETTSRPMICLHRFANLVEIYDKEEASLDKTLADLVKIVPEAMRVPGSALCRIIVSPVAFSSGGYVRGEIRHEAPIIYQGSATGSVEIGYRPGSPLPEDGGFTQDEILMADYLAMRIGRIIELLKTRERLRLESESLKKANIALGEVLRRMQEEQLDIGKSIQQNIKNVISPLIANLSIHLGGDQRKFLSLISKSIEEITSPYVSTLSAEFLTLTPQEIAICHQIRNGLSSKDIAELQKISTATVNTHRENIRRKLKLNNKKINLKSYLISRFEDTSQEFMGLIEKAR
jgi:DNA-binding CsgD family transcriptional regulator